MSAVRDNLAATTAVFIALCVTLTVVMPAISSSDSSFLPDTHEYSLVITGTQGSSYGVIPLGSVGTGGEPSIGVNRFGTLLVGWMNWAGPLSGTSPGLNEVAYSSDNGSSFSAAKVLPRTVQDFESDVSVVSSGANGTFWIGYQSQPTPASIYSSGVTVTEAWNNGSSLDLPILSMLYAAKQYHDREWLGSTPNGTVYQIADVASGPGTHDLLLTRDFNGSGFGQTRVLYTNSYITVGTSAYNDSLWSIGYTTYPSKQAVVLLSSNSGSTWSQTAPLPLNVSSGIDPAAGITGAEWQLAWGQNASLFVVYADSQGISLIKSSDLGATWSAPRIISGNVPRDTSFQAPTISTDTKTGAIGIAWLDTRSGNDTWGVYRTYSLNNGLTWHPVKEISGGVVGTGAKFWPGDFIGSTTTPWGTVGVVWGGNNSKGTLIPYFTQFALSNLSIKSFSVFPPIVTAGNFAKLNVTIAGGTGPFTYSYQGLPDGTLNAGRSSVEVRMTSPGTYNVSVTVTDENHFSVSSQIVQLKVMKPKATGSGILPPDIEYILAAATLAASATLASYAWIRRKR